MVARKPGMTAKTKRVGPKQRPLSKGDIKVLTRCLFHATTVQEVKALLQAGVDPNSLDSDGWQPLHTHALLRRPKLVQLLLDHGAAVNGRAKDTGATPLMVAAAYGLLATVRLLLAAGASVQMEDGCRATALDQAAEGIEAQDVKPNPEVIHALLQAGARVTPKTLDAAASQTNPAIVQLILDAGADVNGSADGHHTALSSAVMVGNTRVAKLLLEAGADPNCRVYQQSALAAAKEAGFTGIAKLLKAAGAH